MIELYLKKTLLLLESEIDNCKMRIMYPNTHHKEDERHYSEELDLDWDISETEMLEFASSLHSAKIAYKNGKDATFIDIERYMEQFFKRSQIKRVHNKKSKLTNRVTITPFLDKLKESFMEDYRLKLTK